ncbi:MAG: 2-C-methyl-D-erythritol 4-phosphate cytidylyltransferase [Candidatus Marinimicrobia bacterium]|nr:2-C-methyl-D-erythritol 4-phosphate cytidylyltransferase [Candidatus Neomarinimicrobiota bacterium]
MKTVSVIIVAAGSGTRMNSGTPKQFLNLGNHTVLFHSIRRFLALSSVIEIIIISPIDYLKSKLLQDSIPTSPSIPVVIIAGGQQRQQSVLNGLNAVNPDASIVCIHDGVRPLIQPKLIQKSIDLCEEYDGAIVAARSIDTLKEVAGGTVIRTIDRNTIWQAQTPQTFRKTVIKKAYEYALANKLNATDDAGFVEAIGGNVAVVESTSWNIKITGPADLLIAQTLLEKETP